MLHVAPHAGAWIETLRSPSKVSRFPVAPHAGAWIETLLRCLGSNVALVAPHAGAWIETYDYKMANIAQVAVAPHAGAWIETPVVSVPLAVSVGRTPRGCVD